MENTKKFLDQIGLAHLWSKIQNELSQKASQFNLISLENRVEKIENAKVIIYGGSATENIEETND